MNKLSLACLAVLTVALTACGGGGAGGDSAAAGVNTTPVANAGAAQSVGVATTLTLNGSGSTDANADPLTYSWTLTSRPAGSAAVLAGATSAAPTFTADVAGTYVASLVVNDGKTNSTPSTVAVTAAVANSVPVANAGVAQNVSIGTVVTLSGSASTDANTDPLTYAWAMTTRPVGSTAALAGATSAAPTFTADLPGTYVVGLVVNDGNVNSTPSTVTVTATAPATNAAPVANAGVAQNVVTGAVVTLTGSGSLDANGDSLTYAWAFTSKPANSAAVLAEATSASPSFIADLPGTYVVGLVVNDGKVNSTQSTVTVTATTLATNAAPVANAGPAQNVVAGAVVTLNGSGSSDANGDPLTYSWTGVSKPPGSTAALAATTSASPTFTADLPGTYVVGLVVNDGKVNSAQSTVTVTAAVPVAPGLSLYLYGGPGNSTYLGCLTCDQFHVEAVCNKFGTYGSEFASLSIWNQFGTYGNQFSSSSPWNQFSTSGPVVIGSDALFYGYFTVNAFQFNRTTVPSLVNVLNFYSSTGNLSATRTYACGN